MAVEVTVGIDIGTTSVKALAVDGDGSVRARARVPHALLARDAGELAHPARVAWRDGVRRALAEVAGGSSAAASGEDLDVRAVNVAAMVPSLCAVDRDGVPVSDGLLYGDARGAAEGASGATADPSSSGELVRFLAWLARTYPEAAGFWPAQAVANAALCGIGAIDTTVAFTTLPLFDVKEMQGWDAEVAASAGVDDVARLPRIVAGSDAVGKVGDGGGGVEAPGDAGRGAASGALVGGGTVDALAEQLVAGADRDGDVLVILGSTLIVWAVVPEWRTVDRLWTVPHTAPGKSLVGGASNAGGLFLDWVRRLLGAAPGDAPAVPATPLDPARVPVWQPYLRGERVPFHDPTRRASLHDLDIGIGPAAARRAAYEASAFAVRHVLDLSGADARRIVATGGGTRDGAWVQAMADGTGLPVDVVAVAEGGALGAAWLARQTAGLERPGADGSVWARCRERVEPDPRWAEAVAGRYVRYRDLAG